MAIKRIPGMTLKEFVGKEKVTQITVQHAENDRITHIKGFKNAANYELQDGQTIWYRKNGHLIKDVYKTPSVVKKITNRLKGKR